MRTVVTAAVAVAVLAGCAPQSTGPQQLSVLREEVAGQPSVVITSPTGERPKALVVYLHGVDDGPTGLMREAPLRGVVDALVSDGYAVVGSEASGPAFGNPASQEEYLALAATASSYLGTRRTFLLAESMGGLAALPLAASGKVQGLTGVVGVNAALSTSGTDALGNRARLEAAWGGAAEDPLSLPPASLRGQHFRLYTASDDVVVPADEHSGRFLETAGSQADVEVVTCSGQHLDPSCYRPAEVVAYFDALLGGSGA